MASSESHSLRGLVVFRNFMYPALIRTVHVYRTGEGVEEEVEREYVFHRDSDYEEIGFCKVFTLQTFQLSAQVAGLANGVWLCIYVFDADRRHPPELEHIPSILSISRNPKLASIPTLANDLHIIAQLSSTRETRETSGVLHRETNEENNDDDYQLRNSYVHSLDLNSIPHSESENEINDQNTPGAFEKKKKRAATKDIARLALEDLAKYFDLPITEASKNLKVGLTVLKRKCREFGIPRWPHRKIKSLDSLIQDLQGEIERQQEDKAAAMVVAKRQRMIESEKKSIEKKPFMEIQRETKKFRQDIFKKRHKARYLEKEGQVVPLVQSIKY